METRELFIGQIEGIARMLGDLLKDVTREEWRSRPWDGQNLFGFTAWHIPASQDWVIHVALQGLPMLSAEPEWTGRGMAISRIPWGMSADQADAVALATKPADVAAYAAAVAERARAFLRFVAPDALDIVPPEGHRTEYDATPGYVAEIDEFRGWPAWRFFASPATGHCRGHLGELDLFKRYVRRPTGG